MTSVHFNEALRERSTRAARSYVIAVRGLLEGAVRRQGERAKQLRSYQQLERTISPEELCNTWPHADVEEALRD